MEERQTNVIMIFLCVIFLSVLHETRALPVIVLRWSATTSTLEARFNDGKWGEVCAQLGKSNEFNDNAGNVSCRQMGFLYGKVHPKKIQVNTSAIVLEEVVCPTGEESSLSKCQIKPATASSKCPYNFTIQVKCTKDPALDGLLNAGLRDIKAHEGILHVTKDGKEGDVCYDATTADAVAKVVCKQIGYSESINQTPLNTLSSTLFYTVNCPKGTEETLAACTISTAATCSTGNVTYVQCKLDKAMQRRFDIRLSSWTNLLAEGTVEVYQYGRWGVICDTDWDIHEAEVVCRELGYKSAKSKETGAKFGQGTGVAFWNKMQCNGDEPSIANCIKDVVMGAQTCDSANAAGVVCNTERIYTINICSNGPKVLEAGYTMIQSEAQPKLFSYSETQTCFLNLTSQTNFNVYIYKKMFKGNHTEHLSLISADRNEMLYGDDSRQGPFDFSSRRLTIEFNADTASGSGVINIMVSATQRHFDIRLSSPKNSESEGTVEVYQYGRWGVVCDTDWDIKDAEVVCRELGYKSAVSQETDAKFGQGSGVVFWNKMQCNGKESSIANCTKDVALGTKTCDSTYAAGVVCNTERFTTIDICSNGPKVLEAGVTIMIQSVAQPKPFAYSKGQTCFLNLTSPTNFTVYIYKKMFQENHVEYLSFISADRNETLYGDDSRQGPFDFNSRGLTIEFKADTAAGEGVINIMVSVAALPSTSPAAETDRIIVIIGVAVVGGLALIIAAVLGVVIFLRRKWLLPLAPVGDQEYAAVKKPFEWY